MDGMRIGAFVLSVGLEGVGGISSNMRLVNFVNVVAAVLAIEACCEAKDMALWFVG